MMHLMPRARVRPLDIFRLPSGLFFAGVGGCGVDGSEDTVVSTPQDLHCFIIVCALHIWRAMAVFQHGT